MQLTTETLAQVTNLLAVVSAPPLETATIRHVEVLLLQPQVAMIVVITSTGGVTKRMLTFDAPVDPGLIGWAGEYLNERLTGIGLGARMLHQRLTDPSLGVSEQRFLDALAPAFGELHGAGEDTIYVEGAARLLGGDRLQDAGADQRADERARAARRAAAACCAWRSARATCSCGSAARTSCPRCARWRSSAAGYGLPRAAASARCR